MDAISAGLSSYALNSLWQILVIAGTAWLCVRLAPRLPSKYYHGIWVAALLLCIVVPPASLQRPNLIVPTGQTGAVHFTRVVDSNPLRQDTSSSSLLRGFRRRTRNVFLSPILQRTVAIAYIAFVVYGVLKLAWAWRRTAQLGASVKMRERSGAVRETVDRLARECSLPPVAIGTSTETTSPFVLGIRRPMVVIPEDIFHDASENDLNSILAHELAHLRRHDFLTNLISEVLSLPIAFHPVTGWLKKRIADSRELACDEIAAEQTASRSGYAQSLLRMARSIAKRELTTNSNAGLGLFETDNLEERVMNLLAKKPRISARAVRLIVGAIGVIFALISIGMSSYTLQVSAATSRAYPGTWRAQYQGKNFLVLSLTGEKENLSGTIRMMNTQIDLKGNGEIYQVSGELSEPTRLTHFQAAGNAISFDYLEEGDTDPVHWRMELTSAASATLNWTELPAGLRVKPIELARDAADESAEPARGTVLSELGITGDVHDPDGVARRVLKAWQGHVFDNDQDLAETVSRSVRSDFQERGYFKVVVHDPTTKNLGSVDGNQRVVLTTAVTEGDQFLLKTLSVQNAKAGQATSIPAGTLREQFHIRDGALFNVSEIRAGMERIVKLYRDRGYSDVAPEPSTSVDESSHRINVIVRITEGKNKS